MKHRVTFLVKPNTPPTVPEQFSLSAGSKDAAKNHIQIKDLHAARQEKWTIARSDIPSKLLDVITPLSELHIRWNSPQAFDSLDPFSSRIPAGLHVQASPQAEATTTDQLCKLLGSAFSTKSLCKNLNETFVDFPGKLQGFYSSHPSVIENAPEQLKGFIKQLVCKGKKACLEEIERLATPDYFDVDYSSRAMDVHALVVTAYWHKGPEEDGKWNHRVQQLYEGHRSEIGIIDQRQAIDDGQLSYGGVLAVLGESQELKPTFFSFPSRHHKHAGTFTGSFKEPEGLHPKFSLKIAKAKAPLPQCTLNAFFTIPKDFFIDKYQLADKQLLESLGLKSLKAFHGDADLEAPTWTQGSWGSSALFELDPKKVNENGQVDVEIPLHMRYQEPSFLSEYTPVHLPWPTVFWACSGNPDYQKFMTNPFDRGYLGYDFAFPKDTTFHHLSPVNGPTYSSVEVPVLEMKNASMVQMGTAAVVGVGFLYVVAKVVGSFKKSDPKKKAE